MRCDEIQGQLADYLTGTLDTRTRDIVHNHVARCQSCRAEFASLSETWEQLSRLAAPTADSGRMRGRFDALLDRHTATPWWRRAIPVNRWALAPALLVLGIIVGRQTAPPAPPNGEMAAVRQEMQQLREMVTLSLLQQQSASERLKGVSWSSSIDRPGDGIVAALLDALTRDPNVNVRLASIDALRRLAEQQGVRQGAIDALGAATSPLVQIALIDFLVEINERQSVPTLQRLVMDMSLDAEVRMRASWGLEQLG